MRDYDKLYINGEWLTAQGEGTLEVVNPATEQVLGRIPAGTAGDAAAGVAAARAAFPAWSGTAIGERDGPSGPSASRADCPLR